MWKQKQFVVATIVLCAFVSSVSAAGVDSETQQVEPRKRYSFLYHGGLYSILIFLAIKIKAVILFFFFFTGLAMLTKLWVATKFGKSYFGGGCAEEPGVVLNHEPYVHEYASPGIHSSAYLDHDPHGGPTYDSPPYPGSYTSRSLPEELTSYRNMAKGFTDSVLGGTNTKLMKNIMRSMDLTELSFNSMGIEDESCKKRFVCEADVAAKRSSLVGFGLYLFSDNGLLQYRDANSTARSMHDCQKLYKSCKSLVAM